MQVSSVHFHDLVCFPDPAKVKLELVLCRSLEDKVREYEIFDLVNFYTSNQFTSAGFQFDKSTGLITKSR